MNSRSLAWRQLERHTPTHTHTHPRPRTHKRALTHTRTHTQTQACTCTHMHTHILTCTHTKTHTYIHLTHMHITHTHTHARTHTLYTHLRAYTHTLSQNTFRLLQRQDWFTQEKSAKLLMAIVDSRPHKAAFASGILSSDATAAPASVAAYGGPDPAEQVGSSCE